MNRLRYCWSDRRYLLAKRRKAVIMWVAWHLPRELVAWCYCRVGAHATTGEYGDTIVPELSMLDALRRWDDRG